MKIENLIEILDADFYTGVPDSQLKPLCNYLIKTFGISGKHIIAANEGNCTALAAGYYLSTGRTPVVYLQNSGLGNIINPVASLLNDEVYAIPCIFIVGWRGEPGVSDEPQHIYQGKVTLKLLKDMGIASFVIGKDMDVETLKKKMEEFRICLDHGKSVAFVVKKGALSYDETMEYRNSYKLRREEIIEHIVKYSKDDIVVSTTGKASRELFEVRERFGQGHEQDFLTVGSMGHSSSIALGIALQKKRKKIWCIDGDGAALMHLGAMAVIGSNKPENLVHIVINNSAHETVGGMPTVAGTVDLTQIALGCGYKEAVCVSDFKALDQSLVKAKTMNGLFFIEVKSAIGAREELGRPTIGLQENKEEFMKLLKK